MPSIRAPRRRAPSFASLLPWQKPLPIPHFEPCGFSQCTVGPRPSRLPHSVSRSHHFLIPWFCFPIPERFESLGVPLESNPPCNDPTAQRFIGVSLSVFSAYSVVSPSDSKLIQANRTQSKSIQPDQTQSSLVTMQCGYALTISAFCFPLSAFPNDRLASSSSCPSAFRTLHSAFERIVPSTHRHILNPPLVSFATTCCKGHSAISIPNSAFPKSAPHSTKQHNFGLSQPTVFSGKSAVLLLFSLGIIGRATDFAWNGRRVWQDAARCGRSNTSVSPPTML